MATPNEPIVYALGLSRDSVRLFTQDLSPQEMLHRTSPAANCAAWLLGHLTLSDRSLMKRAGVTDLPPLPDDGFEKRFSRDEGCPQAEAFGDVSGLLATFEMQRNRIIEIAKGMTPGHLDTPLEQPHPRFRTVGEVLAFIPLHTCVHAGQITLIRRDLGRPPLI